MRRWTALRGGLGAWGLAWAASASWALCACVGGAFEEAALPLPSIGAGSQNEAPEAGPEPATPTKPTGSTAPVAPAPSVTPPATANPSEPSPAVLSTYGYLSHGLDPMTCVDRPVDALEQPGQYIVQLYSCNYTGPQTFVYTQEGALKAFDDNRCLTAPDASNAGSATANVFSRACVPGEAVQQWVPVQGTWRSRASGQCLDLKVGDLGYGARLTTAACSGAQSQQWRPLTNPNTAVPDPTAGAATLAERCTPNVVMSYPTGDANARIFESNLPNFVSDVKKAAREVCAVAFAQMADVPAGRGTLLVRIRSGSDVPLAYSLGHEVGINFNYIASQIASKDVRDIQGMLRHEIAHYYQINAIGAPGWLIEGMAEFVRFKTGHVNAVPQKGKPYTDGYAASGFFLIYVEGLYPGFFNRLMVDLRDTRTGWEMNYFAQKTGKNFTDLWNTYQATL